MLRDAAKRSRSQHAADVSLVWFEHVDRFWDFDPVQFAFGVMTRAKAITYDIAGAEFFSEVDKASPRFGPRADVDVEKPVALMFQRRCVARHGADQRVASPMYGSAKEGVPTDFHFVH